MSKKPTTTLLAKPEFGPLPGKLSARSSQPPIPRDTIRALRVRPQTWARIGTAGYSSLINSWRKRLETTGYGDIELTTRRDANGVMHIYARSNGRFEDKK